MPESDKHAVLTVDELHEMLKTAQDLLIVHTLPEEQFHRVHIAGSHQACVFEVSFVDQVHGLTTDKNTRIVLYGADEKTMDAACAAEKLMADGYTNVAILAGGIAGWLKKGYTTEGSGPAQPTAEHSSSYLTAKKYVIDSSRSSIFWTGRNPNSSHYGTVDIGYGEIEVTDDNLTGRFTIEMSSLKNLNLQGDELQPVLEEHLRSDDFFFTKRYPTATFTLQKALPLKQSNESSPNYQAEGELEMKGVQSSQLFPASIQPLPEGGLSLEAHFDIDRTRWQIIYGSAKYFKHLGMHLVFDHISIELRIFAS